MLDGVAHFRPLVNGDSGFVPRPYTRVMELFDRPLDEEGLRFLRTVGVRHVVSREDLPLPVAAVFEGERVYEVPADPPPPAITMTAGEPVAVRWTTDAIVIDRGSIGSVRGIGFEVDDRPWVAHPRIQASLDGVRWAAVDSQASLADATLALYADPRRGRGQVQFEPVAARYLRVDRRLPARFDGLTLR
jgi:hypothetical protein